MAESEQDAQERSEPATPKRLEEARQKGQVVRSRELNTTALVLGGALMFYFAGPSVVQGLGGLMAGSFRSAMRPDISIELWTALMHRCGDALLILTPLLVAMMLLALLAPGLLGGWVISAESLKPKLEKLDPIKGLQRVFSWQGLMELTKAMLKFLLIMGTMVMILWWGRDYFVSLGIGGVNSGMSESGRWVAMVFVGLSAVTLLIAAVDVPFQLWQHSKRLKMTREEVKEELKQTEGKPEVRSRIRQLQREVANRRMLEAVPSADVVITNPTHYAVALRYDSKDMRAPCVVAKGVDHMAKHIGELARSHDVPVISAPPLARALYRQVKVDHEVPVELYRAVAEVLAHVYALDRGSPPVRSATGADTP